MPTARYATDASIYQQMPLGVFVPRTSSDVANAIAIARDMKVPVLPVAAAPAMRADDRRGTGHRQLEVPAQRALVRRGAAHSDR